MPESRDHIRPWYWTAPILVILFHYVHYYQAYYPFLQLGDSIFIPIATALGAGLLWLLFRKRSLRAAPAYALVCIAVIVVLFFDPIRQLIARTNVIKPVSRIRFFIPLLSLTFAAAAYCILKGLINSRKLLVYFIITSVILIAFETVQLYHKIQGPGSGRLKLKNTIGTPLTTKNSKQAPTIFLLIWDEFTSSKSLREQFGYTYTFAEDSLAKLGFQIRPNTHANYNQTYFSLGSAFNLDYLESPRFPQIGFEDYAAARYFMKENRFMDFLKKHGYSICNYSPFFIDTMCPYANYHLTLNETKAFFQQTMMGQVWRAFNWTALGNDADTTTMNSIAIQSLAYHDAVSSAVLKDARGNQKTPKLVYGHFMLAHRPFVTDTAGARRSASALLHDVTDAQKQVAYQASYVYAAQQMVKLVSEIKYATRGNAVIIVMGDHGFRAGVPANPLTAQFETFNAIYWPGNKVEFPAHISLVNQFRLVLNAGFSQQLPMLADSTIALVDIQEVTD